MIGNPFEPCHGGGMSDPHPGWVWHFFPLSMRFCLSHSAWSRFNREKDPVEGRWLLEARWTAMTNHWAVPLTQEMTDWLVRNLTRKAAHVIEVGWEYSTHVVFVFFWTCGYVISAKATSSLGGWGWPCRNMWNQNLRRKWHNLRTCQDSTEHASPAMKYLSSQNGAHCWTRSDTPKDGLTRQDELSTSKQ